MKTTILKKICLLGDFGVGKTSIANRFVFNSFSNRPNPPSMTEGVSIIRKDLDLPGDAQLSMMIWELAGSEAFSTASSGFLKGAAGGLLVCDLTRPDTLDALQHYADLIQRANPNSHLVLAGNKSDLPKPAITRKMLDRTASLLHLPPPVLTSAKTGLGIQEAFRQLAEQMITPSP